MDVGFSTGFFSELIRGFDLVVAVDFLEADLASLIMFTVEDPVLSITSLPINARDRIRLARDCQNIQCARMIGNQIKEFLILYQQQD